MKGLVLSLFPGIGLLDIAFEEEGFCVVRGPDVLWGGDIRKFHPPAGRFDGVIGGPPCQAFSRLNNFYKHQTSKVNLVPEFCRVVSAAQPTWFVMENVTEADDPVVPGFEVSHSDVRDSLVPGGLTLRKRRFWFGAESRTELRIERAEKPCPNPHQSILASDGGPWNRLGGGGTVVKPKLKECIRLQGLPEGFFGPEPPFTMKAMKRMIGNGVPLPMGRAIAKAVAEAIEGKT